MLTMPVPSWAMGSVNGVGRKQFNCLIKSYTEIIAL